MIDSRDEFGRGRWEGTVDANLPGLAKAVNGLAKEVHEASKGIADLNADFNTEIVGLYFLGLVILLVAGGVIKVGDASPLANPL